MNELSLIKKINIDEQKEKPFKERKLDGLKRRRSNKVNYVLQIEKLWECHAYERSEQSLEHLLRQLRFMIQKKAKYYGRKWNNCKIAPQTSRASFGKRRGN